MTTLTVKPKNKKELLKAKKMLKVLEISFEDNDDKSYDEAFVAMVLNRSKSAKEGNVVKYTPELKQQWFGK